MFSRLIPVLIFCFIGTSAIAQVNAVEFESIEQNELYQTLIKELRCLVCQNQNLADSNAELAKDLRRKVYEMISDGKGYKEITDYMVARYGDFVLYKPRFNSSTYVLWAGPFVLLILIIFATIYRLRKHNHKKPNEYSDKQLEQVKSLIRGKNK